MKIDTTNIRFSSAYSKADAIRRTASFLEELASKLDKWADESIAGGWSTHQVEANRKAADDCRRQASMLRRELPHEPRR